MLGWRETEGDASLRRHVKEVSGRRRRSFQSQETKAAVFGADAPPIADYDRQLTGFTKQVGGPSDGRKNCTIRSIISSSNSCFGVRLSSDGEQKRELGVAVAILHTLQSVCTLMRVTRVCVSLILTSWGDKGKLS